MVGIDLLRHNDYINSGRRKRMAVKFKLPAKKVIDLDGSQGNAYVLLGFANGFAKDLGLDATAIRNEMTSGNYANLVKVFDNYFGDYVDLVTTNPDLLASLDVEIV